jgi:hypothetical protein
MNKYEEAYEKYLNGRQPGEETIFLEADGSPRRCSICSVSWSGTMHHHMERKDYHEFKPRPIIK